MEAACGLKDGGDVLGLENRSPGFGTFEVTGSVEEAAVVVETCVFDNPASATVPLSLDPVLPPWSLVVVTIPTGVPWELV
jgi:hypothetical protein